MLRNNLQFLLVFVYIFEYVVILGIQSEEDFFLNKVNVILI